MGQSSTDISQCGAAVQNHHSVDYDQVRAALQAAELSGFDCPLDMIQIGLL